jgi:hypothetical protein
VKPRLSLLVGATFLIVGVVYYGAQKLADFHIDFAGVTMIIALSAAMTIMFYVLMAGSPREP